MTLALTADTLFRRGFDTQGGVIVEAPDVMDRAAVGRLIGVEPNTITTYLHLSEPGGPYAGSPFPQPSFRLGGRPYWRPELAEAIVAWADARPRRGVGGRPRKQD